MGRKLHEKPYVPREYDAWSAHGRRTRKPKTSRLTHALRALCLVAATLFALALFVDQGFYYPFSAILIGLGAAVVLLFFEPALRSFAESGRLAWSIGATFLAMFVVGWLVWPPLLHVGAALLGIPVAVLAVALPRPEPAVWVLVAAACGLNALIASRPDANPLFPGTDRTVLIVNVVLAIGFLAGAFWLAALRRIESSWAAESDRRA